VDIRYQEVQIFLTVSNIDGAVCKVIMWLYCSFAAFFWSFHSFPDIVNSQRHQRSQKSF